jgi:carbonic anhydrase/acetyltransferase-like protein (isoleucine patch superfamily)
MLYDLNDHQVTLAPDTFIAPNAAVIGRVNLGADSSVWFNAVIRGDVEDITVGACTNIQDGAILHADEGEPLVIGKGVTIGHRAMLHGCRIGDHALIGIGATVLNGAEVGSESIVGAHALITEGKAFPDRVLLLGSPAKVVRELTTAEIESLHDSARHYVANGRRFRQSLQPRP